MHTKAPSTISSRHIYQLRHVDSLVDVTIHKLPSSPNEGGDRPHTARLPIQKLTQNKLWG
uniref:Uncharacterized protein n=1 Tax=Arundo donax TaxID=35708 RepID=A0A0A9RM11_ARUDO